MCSLQNIVDLGSFLGAFFMKYIGKDDDLLNSVSRILDSLISRIDIHLVEHILCIDIYFKTTLRKTEFEKKFKLNFTNVIEYGFYHNDTLHFRYVERYKLFKTERGYYFSFDPFR